MVFILFGRQLGRQLKESRLAILDGRAVVFAKIVLNQ